MIIYITIYYHLLCLLHSLFTCDCKGRLLEKHQNLASAGVKDDCSVEIVSWSGGFRDGAPETVWCVGIPKLLWWKHGKSIEKWENHGKLWWTSISGVGSKSQWLTGAKRREFSGMIPVITSNVIIPATPSNPQQPYVKRTSKVIGDWLVGGLEQEWIMTFHSVGNLILPFDELRFFGGVGQPPTSSDWWLI